MISTIYRDCSECGKPFHVKRWNQVTCTLPECRKSRNKKAEAIHRKAQKEAKEFAKTMTLEEHWQLVLTNLQHKKQMTEQAKRTKLAEVYKINA